MPKTVAQSRRGPGGRLQLFKIGEDFDWAAALLISLDFGFFQARDVGEYEKGQVGLSSLCNSAYI
jgi:hypothetical protein